MSWQNFVKIRMCIFVSVCFTCLTSLLSVRRLKALVPEVLRPSSTPILIQIVTIYSKNKQQPNSYNVNDSFDTYYHHLNKTSKTYLRNGDETGFQWCSYRAHKVLVCMYLLLYCAMLLYRNNWMHSCDHFVT